MVSAALAFVGALVYGSADFLGGLAARRIRSIVVTAVAAFSGMALLLALAPLVGGAPTRADLLWGALSGVTGAIAVGLLYGCLALGPMSVLSPITAVVSAIAPMLWGVLVGGERLGPFAIVGLALAIVAIVLVALLPGEAVSRPSARGLAMAVGSGLAIGAFLILLDQIGDGAGLMPLVLNRLVNGLITGTIAVALVTTAVRAGRGASAALRAQGERMGATPSGHVDAEHSVGAMTIRRAWVLAVACGLVDTTANLLLLFALRTGGDLAVVSALTALYPAGTVLLAAVVLRERIAAVQWAGLGLALTAGVLLAVG
jgi:uncharacterized membrane protein